MFAWFALTLTLIAQIRQGKGVMGRLRVKRLATETTSGYGLGNRRSD